MWKLSLLLFLICIVIALTFITYYQQKSTVQEETENPGVTKIPNELWNTYIDLLANSAYEDLSEEQRPAHLVFWYESEVQNGGHLQYLENQGISRLDETITALDSLGSAKHHEILSRLKAHITPYVKQHQIAIEGFSDVLVDEIGNLDKEIHNVKPSIIEILEHHLEENIDLYIENQRPQGAIQH